MSKEYKLDEETFNPQDRYKDINKFEPEFWKKKLDDMSADEWELICDGCGKCCLNKLEIKDEIHFTKTHCRFLDCNNCACKVYENRFKIVEDCRDIDLPAVREQPRWLPKTCAYWLLDNGFDLPDWHPLISGSVDTVHEQNLSVKGRNTVSEVGIQDYDNYIIDWDDL